MNSSVLVQCAIVIVLLQYVTRVQVIKLLKQFCDNTVLFTPSVQRCFLACGSLSEIWLQLYLRVILYLFTNTSTFLSLPTMEQSTVWYYVLKHYVRVERTRVGIVFLMVENISFKFPHTAMLLLF